MKNKSKLCHCMKAPLKVLRWIGDLYVKSLTDFSKNMGCPAGIIYPTSNRSKEDEALQEMVIISTRKILDQVEEKKPASLTQQTGSRSERFPIGRIDEDRPCYFPQDFKVDLDKIDLDPRKRSSTAVMSKRL